MACAQCPSGSGADGCGRGGGGGGGLTVPSSLPSSSLVPVRACWQHLPHGWQCTFAHHESELHPDSW